MESAYKKYNVVFDDGSQKQTDRFDLVARFGSLGLKEKDGILIYKGNNFSFEAFPINEVVKK